MAEITDKLERQHLVQDLLHENESDEEAGGEHCRVEFDSDFSLDDEEEEYDFKYDDSRSKVEGGQGGGGEGQGDGWAPYLTTQRRKGNTGPKGVKADYEEATRIQKRMNETRKLKQREALKQAGGYGITNAEDGDTSGFELSGKTVQAYDEERENDGDDEDSGDEGGESDPFYDSFRRQRLQQLKMASNLPQNGRLKAVDKFEFVEEVDNANPNAFVVVHLYEDYLATCRRMNGVLEQLASRYPHVKFLKLKATEADQTLSHSALPAFSVYKAGKLVKDSSINVVKTEIGNEYFGTEEVEWLLASKYGIPLPGVDVSEKEVETDARTQSQGQAHSNSSGTPYANPNGNGSQHDPDFQMGHRREAAASDAETWQTSQSSSSLRGLTRKFGNTSLDHTPMGHSRRGGGPGKDDDDDDDDDW